MLISDIISYTKLATRAINTDLSDAELLTLVGLSLNKVYIDLELTMNSHVITPQSTDFNYILPEDYISVLQIEILLDNGNYQYMTLNDTRDKELYVKLDTSILSTRELSFHIKEYDKVDKVTIYYSTSVIPNALNTTDNVPLALLEPIMLYVNYLTYTLLGLKDLQVAMFHKQEYVETIDRLKSTSGIFNSYQYLIPNSRTIQDKGYV